MKYKFSLAVLSALALAACGQKSAESPAASTPFVPAPPPAMQAASAPAVNMPVDTSKMTPIMSAEPQLTEKGEVRDVIQLPQYTYMEVEQDGKTRWLAAINVAVKKGDSIRFDAGTTMANFNSKQLNRTFPSLTFVSRVTVEGGKGQ